MRKALSNVDELLIHTVTCLTQSSNVCFIFQNDHFYKKSAHIKGGLPIFGEKMKPRRLAGITHKPAHFIFLGLGCFYTTV